MRKKAFVVVVILILALSGGTFLALLPFDAEYDHYQTKKNITQRPTFAINSLPAMRESQPLSPHAKTPASSQVMQRYLLSMREDYADMEESLNTGDGSTVAKNAKRFWCTLSGFEKWIGEKQQNHIWQHIKDMKGPLRKIIEGNEIKIQKPLFEDISWHFQALSKTDMVVPLKNISVQKQKRHAS